jgi:hypothetical protein
MRKFTTIGLGTLASASLAFGVVAGPATAVTAPPLASAVCTGLPAQLLSAANTLATVTLAQTTAIADVALKTPAFAASQAAYATAVADYVKAVDAGTPLAGKTQTVYDTLGTYSDKLAAWSNAVNAKNEADKAVFMAGVTNNILNGIGSGLSC